MKSVFTNAEQTHTLVYDYTETAEISPIVVNFYAYEIIGVIEGDPDAYIYDNDLTDLDKATPFAHGFVKWDGYMELDITHNSHGWNRSLDYLLRDIYLQTGLVLGESNFPNMAALRAHHNITT